MNPGFVLTVIPVYFFCCFLVAMILYRRTHLVVSFLLWIVLAAYVGSVILGIPFALFTAVLTWNDNSFMILPFASGLVGAGAHIFFIARLRPN